MEEKKKRWRPSLTAYREMEETVHRQCVELDAWREKYRALDREMKALRKDFDSDDTVPKSDYKTLMKNYKTLEKKSLDYLVKYNDLQSSYDFMKSEVSTLEQSNKSMESELRRKSDRESKELNRWKEKAIEAETEVMRLLGRGFWARLFNM